MVTSVNTSPQRRLLRSLTRPISHGEGASPSAWMRKSSIAMAEARTSGPTAFTIAAFRGPFPSMMKKMASARPGTIIARGPKKHSMAAGTASSADKADTQ